MNERTKRRINGLDVLVVLLLAAAIAAFCLRGWVRSLFSDGDSHIVTYAYAITDVEPLTADSLQVGTQLYSAEGLPMGEVLTCIRKEATDEQVLSDGRTVRVLNGLLDLSGSVTAVGYLADGFVYLNGGILLVAGGELTVSTGDALFTVRITSVQTSEGTRAN